MQNILLQAIDFQMKCVLRLQNLVQPYFPLYYTANNKRPNFLVYSISIFECGS